MSHAVWRTRAARSAEAPIEELTLVHEDGVEIDLWMDGLASFSLTLRQTVSKRNCDDRTVIQDELTLSCKACTEVLYRSKHGVVQLEDLSEVRTTGQLHLSECTPKAEAEAVVPADQTPIVDPRERRTYCD